LTLDGPKVKDRMGQESAIPAPPESQKTEGAVERHHASDRVFREIAAAILNRKLAPEAPLPPERELSERFGVSRIVVREAIHRLKEYELVRVRQGSPTIVLDPDLATDMRLLGLEIELVPPTPEALNAFAERQIYSAAAILDLAEQRMYASEMDAMEDITERMSQLRGLDEEWLALERAYWTTLSQASRNRVYVRETLWYFNLLERDPRFRAIYATAPAERAAFYRLINVALRSRTGTAARYLDMLRKHQPRLFVPAEDFVTEESEAPVDSGKVARVVGE
jgi:GntR family transcriptional repressor for pyruvate dehydrogenase complex